MHGSLDKMFPSRCLTWDKDIQKTLLFLHGKSKLNVSTLNDDALDTFGQLSMYQTMVCLFKVRDTQDVIDDINTFIVDQTKELLTEG